MRMKNDDIMIGLGSDSNPMTYDSMDNLTWDAPKKTEPQIQSINEVPQAKDTSLPFYQQYPAPAPAPAPVPRSWLQNITDAIPEGQYSIDANGNKYVFDTRKNIPVAVTPEQVKTANFLASPYVLAGAGALLIFAIVKSGKRK